MSATNPRNEAEIVEFVRSIDERAPEHVHERLGTLLADGTGRSRGALPGERFARRAALARSIAAVSALVACAVAVALLVAFAGGGGAGGAPTLRATAAFTLRAATLAAPPESRRNRGQLDTAVDGVAFPYWEESFGWRATGARLDSLGGRRVRTVFYSDDRGRRIGYSILAGTPAPAVHGGGVVLRGDTPYRLLALGGANAVAWLRGGRLCIVSGRGIGRGTLLRLASWEARARATA